MLKIHEIATLFPAMAEVDVDDLQESIRKEGQLEDILLFEGKILDGRHRYEACKNLGVEPRTRDFEGTAEEAFAHSVALNLSRRHLTTVQRAAAGAGIKDYHARLLGAPAEDSDSAEADAPAEEASASVPDDTPVKELIPQPRHQGPSPRKIHANARTLASQRVGVSPRAIDTASKIKKDAPDVFQRMLEGKAGTMPEAKKVTSLPEDVRARVHQLVDEGTKLKAALLEVTPSEPRERGPVFLGRVVLEPDQARAFEDILEKREIKRADAAKEAVLAWIEKHGS